MTPFITFGLVGLGAEGVWPVFQLRLLLLSVGVVFGGMIGGYQQALAKAVAKLRGQA